METKQGTKSREHHSDEEKEDELNPLTVSGITDRAERKARISEAMQKATQVSEAKARTCRKPNRTTTSLTG